MSLADLHEIHALRQKEAALFESIPPALAPRKVVFYSVDPWKIGVVEQLLHLALQLRGHRPVSIYYDGFLTLSPWENYYIPPPPAEQLIKRFAFIFGSFGIDAVGMSAYLNREDTVRQATALIASLTDGELKPLCYRGIPIGRIAWRDLFQFTLGHLDDYDPIAEELYRVHLVHAVVSVDLAYAIIEREQPDVVVLVCGKSVMYSYMYEVCRHLGIQATTWEEGKFFDTSVVLANNDKAIDFPIANEVWDRYRDIPLTPEQERAIEAYYEKWRNQTANWYVYYDREDRDYPGMMAALGLPPKTPYVALFPNIIWDSNALEKDRAFQSMFDWVCANIDFIRGREGALLIRAHPGEVRLPVKTRTPIKELIAARYGAALPPNVRVIDNTSEYSSYEIARHARHCAVYTSTLGIELSLMGLRPLICGLPYYSGKGITNDMQTRDEYFAILSGEREPREVDRRLLKRFLHLVIYRLVKQPEFLVGIYDHPQRPRIHISTFEGFPESMPVFNEIMECILANGNFVDEACGAASCAQ